MKRLKMGVIGCGSISEGHIRSYIENENTELIALCDIDKPWLKCAGDIYGVSKLYTDYHEMLEDKALDGVSVCLPNYLHAPVSISALKKGLHVLCEKPMTINAELGCAMRDAEQSSGARLMISQNQRFLQDVQILKRLYDEGAFGEVYHVRIGWRRPLGGLPSPLSYRPNGMAYNRNWFNEKEKGGGVLRDLGSHLLDLTMYILDFPKLKSITAQTTRKFVPNVPEPERYEFSSEDFASAYMKFEGGIGVQLEVSFGSPVEKESLFTSIYGTKLGAHRSDGNVLLIKPTTNGGFTVEEVKDYPGVIPYKHPSYFFIDAILNDKSIPVPSDQGIKVIEVLDAVYKSSEES